MKKKLDQYDYIPCRWKSKGRKGYVVDTCVIHYTGGRSEADVVAQYFKKGRRKASAHFVIGRDGKVIQTCQLTDSAWHAGKSSFMGDDRSVNRRSVGVELCNSGYAYTERLDEKDKFYGRHRNPLSKSKVWEQYREETYKALYVLLADLQKEIPTLKYITFHEDIKSPFVAGHLGVKGSKLDVGPAFDASVLEAGKEWADYTMEQVHFNFKTKKWEFGIPK